MIIFLTSEIISLHYIIFLCVFPSVWFTSFTLFHKLIRFKCIHSACLFGRIFTNQKRTRILDNMYLVYQQVPPYCQLTTCSGSWYIPVIQKPCLRRKWKMLSSGSVDSGITFLFARFTGVNMHVLFPLIASNIWRKCHSLCILMVVTIELSQWSIGQFRKSLWQHIITK